MAGASTATADVSVGASSVAARPASVLVAVVPDAPLGVPMPTLHQIEHTNRGHQRAAAAASGATYVEMMHPSRHHSTCARDSQRWVAGVIDPHAQHNMGLHPTPAGSRFMAEEISRHL